MGPTAISPRSERVWVDVNLLAPDAFAACDHVSRSLVSDGEGNYRLLNLPVGGQPPGGFERRLRHRLATLESAENSSAGACAHAGSLTEIRLLDDETWAATRRQSARPE